MRSFLKDAALLGCSVLFALLMVFVVGFVFHYLTH